MLVKAQTVMFELGRRFSLCSSAMRRSSHERDGTEGVLSVPTLFGDEWDDSILAAMSGRGAGRWPRCGSWRSGFAGD